MSESHNPFDTMTDAEIVAQIIDYTTQHKLAQLAVDGISAATPVLDGDAVRIIRLKMKILELAIVIHQAELLERRRRNQDGSTERQTENDDDDRGATSTRADGIFDSATQTETASGGTKRTPGDHQGTNP